MTFNRMERLEIEISKLNQAVADRDRQITGLSQAISNRDKHITDLNQIIVDRDRQIADLLNSISWKLTAPLRRLRRIKGTTFWIFLQVLVSFSRRPSLLPFKQFREYLFIRKNNFFDKTFYLENNRDVSSDGVDPAWHYVISGSKERRLFHPTFDSQFYLNEYPEVIESGLTPLGHYLKIGINHNRNINILHKYHQNRKVILIVDWQVPTFDQDAGSRTIYHYINLFIKMGFYVMFFPTDQKLIQPYAASLTAIGVKILTFNDIRFDLWIKTTGRFLDFVLLNRPDCTVNYIDLIKSHTQAKCIYNSVDFHYLRFTREFKLTREINKLKLARKYKLIEFDIISKVDVFVAFSEYEKDIVRRKFPKKPVYTFPIFIYEGPFPLGKNNKLYGFDDRNCITFVGGFNHKPNVDGVLWFLDNIFPNIVIQYKEILFNIIGSHPPPEILRLQSRHVNVTGYISDDELEKYYSKTRVIIAPIRYGAGIKGKIIEAIAYGIPVVTTTIGGEGITNSENVISIALDAESFTFSTIELFTNPALWQQYRNNEIDYANRYLSVDTGRDIFKRIFSQSTLSFNESNLDVRN